jgi:glycosyltransferase involved in cell wall biosynthesis
MNCIDVQTYKNYRVIVSVDNDETQGYVTSNGIAGFVIIDKSIRGKYNLYLNVLIAETREGFNWIIDDDDFMPHDKVLEVISRNLNDDMISIFKMKKPRAIHPSQNSFGRVIQFCDIGTPCFVVPVEIAKQVLWQHGAGMDYRYIKELSDKIGMEKINWVNEIICEIDKPNQHGKSEI